jgi:hypothetical protein
VVDVFGGSVAWGNRDNVANPEGGTGIVDEEVLSAGEMLWWGFSFGSSSLLTSLGGRGMRQGMGKVGRETRRKKYLSDMIIPLLNSNAHFDCFFHEARGNDDGVDLPRRGGGNFWCRHDARLLTFN